MSNIFIDAVLKELSIGDKLLGGIGFSVSIFGSARTDENSKFYLSAERLAYSLAENGINIITGGGPGIMEAANKGAYKSGKVESIGLNIILDREQSLNKFTTKTEEFENFFTRKLMLRKYSDAFVCFPGGFGTLDEMMEIITLVQTGKMTSKKIFLFSSEFFNPLISFFKTGLLDGGMIVERDLMIFEVVDSETELLEKILKHKSAS